MYNVLFLNFVIDAQQFTYQARSYIVLNTLRSSGFNSQFITNKTGLQPVSRPVELVHYFGGWLEGAKSLCAKTLLVDRSGGARCTIVGTK